MIAVYFCQLRAPAYEDLFLTRNASHTLYGKRPILQQYSSLKNLKGKACEKSEQYSLNLTVIISAIGKQLHHLQFLQIRFLDA